MFSNSTDDKAFVVLLDGPLDEILQDSLQISQKELIARAEKNQLILVARFVYKPGFWGSKKITQIERRNVYFDEGAFFIGQYLDAALD